MKKFFLYLILSLAVCPELFAYDTGHSEDGVFKRIAKIEMRGLLNIIGLPAELIRTPIEESRVHKKVWPVTMFPRILTNIFTRAVSGIYDAAFAPFVQPFSNDTSPLTDGLGLPDYPWQIRESLY